MQGAEIADGAEPTERLDEGREKSDDDSDRDWDLGEAKEREVSELRLGEGERGGGVGRRTERLRVRKHEKHAHKA